MVPIALNKLAFNNWADRQKFLASFFERGSRGSSAVLSVASGNALSNLRSFWSTRVPAFPTRWGDPLEQEERKKGARR